MRLFARFGDASNYYSFDDLEALKKAFRGRSISKPITRRTEYALDAPGYDQDVGSEHSGGNWLSVFYGENDRQPLSGLSDYEIEELNAA